MINRRSSANMRIALKNQYTTASASVKRPGGQAPKAGANHDCIEVSKHKVTPARFYSYNYGPKTR
jgi:hypothetical protein